jgi:hypothetical protein
MTLDDLKKEYGTSYRFSKKTGLSHVNWVHWHKFGFIPILSQMKLERISGGALRADLNHVPQQEL